jgi:hypothetical protein
VVDPMHSISQGNGAGPAIWAVVSTPLLDILRNMGFGFSYITHLSNQFIRCVGFAFVDNTDLLQVLHHNSSREEVTKNLQESLDLWEGILSAKAGDIVPEKNFWYQVDFTWNRGEWRYKTIVESPAELSVCNITGHIWVIQWIEVTQAEETLGIFMAPNGTSSGQLAKLEKLVAQWVISMKTGHLTKQEMWVAFQSTIWRNSIILSPGHKII